MITDMTFYIPVLNAVLANASHFHTFSIPVLDLAFADASILCSGLEIGNAIDNSD